MNKGLKYGSVDNIKKAQQHKYFKREGTPGHYKYYYTEAEYKEAKGMKDDKKVLIKKEDVIPFKNFMDRELWTEKDGKLEREVVDEKTGEVTKEQKSISEVYNDFKESKERKEEEELFDLGFESQTKTSSLRDHLEMSKKDLIKKVLSLADQPHKDSPKFYGLSLSNAKQMSDNYKELAKYCDLSRWGKSLLEDKEYLKELLNKKKITEEEYKEGVKEFDKEISKNLSKIESLYNSFSKEDKQLLTLFDFYYHDGEGGRDFLTFRKNE